MSEAKRNLTFINARFLTPAGIRNDIFLNALITQQAQGVYDDDDCAAFVQDDNRA